MRPIRPILATGAVLALAGAMVVAPASAAELDITPTVTIDRTAASAHQRYQVTVDLPIPDSAQPGDTFTLALGPGLVMASGAVDLRDADGNLVATVTQTGTTLTYTLTDYVLTHDDVGTHLSFWASTETTVVEPGSSVSVDVVVNGRLVDGPDVAVTDPGTGGTHAEFKWMNWVDNGRDLAVWGISSLKRHYDVETLSITDTPGAGLDMVCDDARWPQVFVGPDRSTFGTDASWRYKLPADRYSVDCTAERVVVTVTGTADAPAVPAFLDVEVRGLVRATATQGEYTNDATIVENDVTLPGRGATLSQYDSSGSAYGELGSVAVGDYVWLDADRDGVQDADEAGIPGVVLVLTGPDGQPVRDVKGVPVGPATTDADGAYAFLNLPILKEGEAYTVTVDEAASADALEGLVPTTPGATDRANDSSIGSASSEGLTVKGEADMTLDFGYHAEDEGTKSEEPTTPPTDEPTTPPTGDDEGTKPEGPTTPPTTNPGTNRPPSMQRPTDGEGVRPAAPTRTTPRTRAPQRTQLARTGVELGLLALAGGGLIASGGGLLAWRRRRGQ